MSVPKDLKYTEEHEWVRFEEDRAVIGITDYAQEALGEIVFVELPVEGEELVQGDSFGAAESTKAVSELFAPVSGEIAEVNDLLVDSPELVNADPYGDGWIVKIHTDELDKSEVESLLDPSGYEELIEDEEDA
ncbi:MAG: glycine cleavage system protein GcvH [Candidatus Dadabacteria bacterium]|nr:glycine cleavage system protein GcvH [Candidatus Dadabacteria bacterium]MDE0477900.1 glycine cleavage system protein GcvH [Candidatus Dadabacteria bacterium]MXW43688.1 glycine cleavage system protein GcvH [Candidatus Dadabacteria bacterium]MYB26406.1 glycine cleavage system protein GcvH [Candidatus Dadabacteria bacterium]